MHEFSAQLHLQATLNNSTGINVPFSFFFFVFFSTKTLPKAPSGCMVIKVLNDDDGPLSYATLHLTSSYVPRVRRISDASFGSLLLN